MRLPSEVEREVIDRSEGASQILPLMLCKGIHLEYAQQPVDAQVHVPHARVRVGLWVGGPHRQPEVPPELEADVDDVGGDRTVEQQRTVGIEELSRDGKWLREVRTNYGALSTASKELSCIEPLLAAVIED